MSVNFKLEYNPKTQQLKIIDDNPFNNVWLGADSFDHFNNPMFKLSYSYGNWTIKMSRSGEWFIASGQIQRRNYNSFQRIKDERETFPFSCFNVKLKKWRWKMSERSMIMKLKINTNN